MLLLNVAIRFAAAVLQIPPDVLGSSMPMIAPLPKSIQELRHRRNVDERMHDWHIVLPKAAESESQSGPPAATIYGEVTNLGARQLFDYMGLYNTKNKRNAGSTTTLFVDLGSGMGKLVLQASLELRIPTIGIELDPVRHDIAMKRFNQVQEDVHNVQLHCGDLFELDAMNMTHVYVSSLLFSTEMMERLSTKLFTEAPNLKVIATLQPLSRIHFSNVPVIEFVEMSWTRPRGCSVYIYHICR